MLVSPTLGKLVTLSWEGRWCPQGGEHWWHWVGSDAGDPNVGTLVTLGLQDVGVGGPLWPYGGHCALMAAIMALWRPLCPYGDHCALMVAIVPLWLPLCPYGDHCALMVTIVPLW